VVGLVVLRRAVGDQRELGVGALRGRQAAVAVGEIARELRLARLAARLAVRVGRRARVEACVPARCSAQQQQVGGGENVLAAQRTLKERSKFKRSGSCR